MEIAVMADLLPADHRRHTMPDNGQIDRDRFTPHPPPPPPHPCPPPPPPRPPCPPPRGRLGKGLQPRRPSGGAGGVARPAAERTTARARGHAAGPLLG